MSDKGPSKSVAAEKSAANAAEAGRVVTANTRLEELFVELRQMWELEKERHAV